MSGTEETAEGGPTAALDTPEQWRDFLRVSRKLR